jgi:hypothetical protein
MGTSFPSPTAKFLSPSQINPTMNQSGLSYNSRKALINNIGEAAGTEIANLINELVAEVEELRRTKVTVTRIVPGVMQDRTELIEEPV